MAALAMPLASAESSIEIARGTYNYNIRAYIVNRGNAILQILSNTPLSRRGGPFGFGDRQRVQEANPSAVCCASLL